MRGSNLTYLVRQGVTSIWHNRMMSFASFCILMVSLLLIGLVALIGINVNIVIGNIEDKNEIMVFVDGEMSASEISHITSVIKNNSLTLDTVYRSKEEAWELQKEKMGDEYGDLFDYLGENPMPNTFIVTINDITKIEDAVRDYSAIEGVERVNAPYDFAHFLVDIRNTLSIIGGAVLLALVIVCIVIIYNTARSSVFARRMEISIMKSVGATNSFIRLPFFVEGIVIGLIAGGVSWILTKVAYESIMSIFMSDMTIWQVFGLVNIIPFSDVMWIILAADCLAGAILGVVGTMFSMGKHLKV